MCDNAMVISVLLVAMVLLLEKNLAIVRITYASKQIIRPAQPTTTYAAPQACWLVVVTLFTL